MNLELNRIYNEDCLEGMKRIPDNSVDCIICDLPYGVLNKQSSGGKWDSVIPFEPLWEQYKRVAKDNAAIVLFAQGMFTADLMQSNRKMWRYNLVWQKGSRSSGFLNANRMPMRNHEDICVFYGQQPVYNPQMRKGFPNHTRGHGSRKMANGCYGKYDVTKYSRVITDDKYPISVINVDREHDVKKYIHPTQKPVALIEYLIRTYTNRGGGLILDNCMGSGTTAIACIRTHRNYIGFELDKDYYDKAQERIRLELAAPRLDFGEP